MRFRFRNFHCSQGKAAIKLWPEGRPIPREVRLEKSRFVLEEAERLHVSMLGYDLDLVKKVAKARILQRAQARAVVDNAAKDARYVARDFQVELTGELRLVTKHYNGNTEIPSHTKTCIVAMCEVTQADRFYGRLNYLLNCRLDDLAHYVMLYALDDAWSSRGISISLRPELEAHSRVIDPAELPLPLELPARV